METRKLYYEDCHCRQFTAAVTGCEETEKGYWITLNATAFYPEGGGQACDLGTLDSVRVLDVQEQGTQVVHLCDGPLEIGAQVTGVIDWQRRFDLMQQHSGEHILSGLIHGRYGYHNVGFHVGKEAMEVDFDGPIPPEALAQLEQQANEAIWKNLPIQCWYPSQETLAELSYRTKKPLAWPVRIVQVPGYDSCACCGVHVAYTGEVGLIKILSCVKLRGGVRLEMLCGRRAYEYVSRVCQQNQQVSQAFSAHPLQTGDAACRMNEQLATEKLRAASLEKRVFDTIAAGYTDRGNVLHFEDGLASAGVRELADRIARSCGGVAAVFSETEENNYSLCLVGSPETVRDVSQRLVKILGARGGGKPGFFQGSIRAARDEIETLFW